MFVCTIHTHTHTSVSESIDTIHHRHRCCQFACCRRVSWRWRSSVRLCVCRVNYRDTDRMPAPPAPCISQIHQKISMMYAHAFNEMGVIVSTSLSRRRRRAKLSLHSLCLAGTRLYFNNQIFCVLMMGITISHLVDTIRTHARMCICCTLPRMWSFSQRSYASLRSRSFVSSFDVRRAQKRLTIASDKVLCVLLAPNGQKIKLHWIAIEWSINLQRTTTVRVAARGMAWQYKRVGSRQNHVQRIFASYFVVFFLRRLFASTLLFAIASLAYYTRTKTYELGDSRGLAMFSLRLRAGSRWIYVYRCVHLLTDRWNPCGFVCTNRLVCRFFLPCHYDRSDWCTTTTQEHMNRQNYANCIDFLSVRIYAYRP